MYESQLRSIFTERLVGSISDWFGMTEDQTVLLRALWKDHLLRFNGFVEEVAPIWQRLEDAFTTQPLGTVGAFEALVAWETGVSKIADRQEALDMEFLSDIQAILYDEQRERWDAFRMWLHRQRWGGRPGMYVEQAIDLIALLQQVDRAVADEPSTVPPELVNEYAALLDEAIVKLVRFEIGFSRNRNRNDLDRVQTDGERTWLGTPRDPKRLERENQDRLRLNRRIRDLNQQYAVRFAAALPEDKQRAWRRIHLESLLARIHATSDMSQETRELIGKTTSNASRLERLVALARQRIADLNENQVAAIALLEEQTERALESAVRRMIAAHDEFSDASFRGVVGTKRDALEMKFRDAIEAFAAVERVAITTMRAILTDEQRAHLDGSS